MPKRSLHTIVPAVGSTHAKKRVGRGLGSTGTYSGRGGKGQTARSGVSGLKKLGMRPLMLATPKVRGFKSITAKAVVVKLSDLNLHFADGAVVTPAALAKAGLISSAGVRVKILSNGVLSKKLTLKGCGISAAGAQKVKEAGGTLVP